jgi:hypothetical protein
LVALLTAREPHEKLIREGALERRELAERVRDEARARAAIKAQAAASPTGEPEGVSAARFGLNTLGFVPPGMVASGTLNALAAGLRNRGGEAIEPNKRARPPAEKGLHPVRPRTLDRIRPDLQALRQHDYSRTERSASLALSSSGAWEAGMGGWVDGASNMNVNSSTGGGGGGGGGSLSSSPLGSGGSGGLEGGEGGGGGVGGALVRVGVSVEDILAEKRSSTALGGSRRPLPSPLHPRTPWGTIRPASDLARAASDMPAFTQPTRGAYFAPTADQDYALSTDHPVAFRAATKDLPVAAVAAVRGMLLDHHRLTVSSIHQRRPPYLDVGNPATLLAHSRREMHPSQFTQQLRKNEDDAFRAKKKSFTLGATAPWNKSKYTPSGLDTFDFMAKQSAVRYYVTDFTEPSGAPLRPPSRGPTRFASNVPSMLSRDREGPLYAAKDTNRLL